MMSAFGKFTYSSIKICFRASVTLHISCYKEYLGGSDIICL